MMKFGLKPATLSAIQRCMAHCERIDEAIIYGSRAKGNFRPASDIDVTLKGNHLTRSDVAKLEDEIDDLLLPYQFDISIYHQIDNPSLADRIERIGVSFYKKKSVKKRGIDRGVLKIIVSDNTSRPDQTTNY